LFLNQAVVTNVFSAPVQFVDATSAEVTRTVTPTIITFSIGRTINPGEAFSFFLTVRPTRVGSLTNHFTATSAGTVERPDGVLVTTVSTPMARSDLTMSIDGLPTSPIFAGDWVPYRINVLGQGPDPVSGVVVSTTIPSGAELQGYFPSNIASVNGQQLTFNLGTLNQTNARLHVTIQPNIAITNLPLSARITTPAGAETNTNNNSATNFISVVEGMPGQLNSEILSNQEFNPQTALFEQLIRVTNIGTTSVPSARVIVSNFQFKVVNAVGTNNGFPFVVHGGALRTNESVELLLEYFFRDRNPHEDPELLSYPVGNVNLAAVTGGTNVAITNIVLPSNDRVMVRFPARPGATYAINYSSNMAFSGAMKAQPLLVAQANYVHWIDYGPPKTISRPLVETYMTNTVMITNAMDTNMVTTNIVVTTNSGMRFYQAIEVAPPQ
jgi:hypothetical protein